MKIDKFNTKTAPFIIAELSANHANSLELAKKSIQAAKQAGANAIKLQSYTPKSLTLDSSKEEFVIKGGLWDGYRLWDLYKEAMTPRKWHEELFAYAKELDILCFSTPFSEDDLDFLRAFNPPAYKIASFEANDLDFVRLVAREQKPTLISCGILDKEGVLALIDTFKEEKNDQLILLKCTSSYPAAIDELNLNNILALKDLGCEVGLSDHSAGFLAPVMAVAMGVRVIEKHFIIDKNTKSPDASFSLDFKEFKELCFQVNLAFKALGDGGYSQKGKEFARSLYANKDIKKGSLITPGQIACVRPFKGLDPKYKEALIGSVAKRDIAFSEPFSEQDL